MPTDVPWSQFVKEAPETVAVFQRRLDATGLALMATLRADGFPRISPLEPMVAEDRLWLGMMPGSTKVADLRRDPRLCIHTSTDDKDVKEGDAKLWGRGVAVTSDEERASYAAAFQAATGHDVYAMPGGFEVFAVELTGASSLVLGDDGEQHLRITTWTPGTEETITRRT